MIWLNQWFKKWRYSTKQFIFIFIFAYVIFISLSFNNLTETKQLLTNQKINDSQLMIDRTNLFMDMYLNNIKDIMLSISSQKNILLSSKTENINNYLYECSKNYVPIIKTLYYLDSNKNIYSSKKTLYSIVKNDKLDEIFNLCLNNFGSISWSEPYYTPISGDTLAFSLPMFDSNNTFLGLVIVEIDRQYLTNKIGPWLVGTNNTFLVLSLNGNVISYDKNSRILPFKEKVYPKQIEQNFIDDIYNMEDGINNYNDLCIISSKSNNLGWQLSCLISKKTFNHSLKQVYHRFILTILLGLFSLLAITFLISYYINIPLRNLAEKMDKVNDYTNLKPVQIKNKDGEIGMLATSYNALIKRIQNLIVDIKESESKKKEYELKVLQSQIGPHFLYNTLACIGSLAKQNKINDVCKTLRSLISLYSYTFDKTSEMVTLQEEIEGLKMYINIEKIRYGNKFESVFKVDENLLNNSILKLALQPLVENAIFHGILPKLSKGTLVIKVKKINDKYIKIQIFDNGVGFKNFKVVLKNKPNKHSRDRFTSIGLKNVNERIKLYFGNNYGLKIRSKKNVGTVVTLLIPNI